MTENTLFLEPTEESILEKSVLDRLEKLCDQLLDTLDRETQEHQLMMKEREGLVKLTQLLIHQTKEIGQYENGIRKRIQDCIKESSHLAMEKIERSISEKSNQSIEESVSKINQTCQSVEKMLEANYREKTKSSWKIISVAVLTGILSSMLMTWIFIPQPVLPLTTEQISYLQDGEMLAKVWPKLTKQEREKLKAVSSDVA
jgi:hypothetical protein